MARSDSRETDRKEFSFCRESPSQSSFVSGGSHPLFNKLKPAAQLLFSCAPTCFTMSGFDDPGVYYSDSFGGGDGPGVDEGGQKRIQIKKRFREFLRQFRVGTDRTGFTYKYR